MLTAVSLFAGVGGFDIALERAGVKVTAMVEWDKNAQGVLRHRFPDTALFGDVQEVSGDGLRAAGFVPERWDPHRRVPLPGSIRGRQASWTGWRTLWPVLGDHALVRRALPEVAHPRKRPGLLSS
jgi:hypothetical protein